MDEITTNLARRGRGRTRLKDGPPILVHDNGRRVVRTKKGKYLLVENYAVVNHRCMEEVLGHMTQAEIRRAMDLEHANPLRRRRLLLRMTTVLHTLMRNEALDTIKRTIAPQLPRQGRRHTVPQMEQAALATFGPATRGPTKGKPRRSKGSSYRSTLTKRMRERKAEIEAAYAAQVALHGPLTKRARQELRRLAGDHFCGNPCRICGSTSEGFGT
jgi:hypothetical protein